MTNNEYIKNLFEQLNKDGLSVSELQTLNDFLNDKKGNCDLLFSDEWEKSPHITDEYKSNLQWEILRNKLKLSNTSSDIQLPRKIKHFFYQSLKYAAILILGISISWLMNTKINTHTNSKQCSIAVAYGSKATIQLPDGSIVHLNSGSTLSYPSNFEKSNRTVSLDGEGFFDVTKDSTRPFYVKTEKITIKVLGTSFNVKAYPDENKTVTTLVTGKIEIFKNEENILPYHLKNKIAILKPKQNVVILNNYQIVASKTEHVAYQKTPSALKVSIKIDDQIKTELYTDWKKDVLIFNNEKFTDIATILERWYNVEISMKYENIKDIRFSGKFDLESVSEVLDALSLIQNFKYEIRKNKITIY